MSCDTTCGSSSGHTFFGAVQYWQSWILTVMCWGSGCWGHIPLGSGSRFTGKSDLQPLTFSPRVAVFSYILLLRALTGGYTPPSTWHSRHAATFLMYPDKHVTSDGSLWLIHIVLISTTLLYKDDRLQITSARNFWHWREKEVAFIFEIFQAFWNSLCNVLGCPW